MDNKSQLMISYLKVLVWWLVFATLYFNSNTKYRIAWMVLGLLILLIPSVFTGNEIWEMDGYQPFIPYILAMVGGVIGAMIDSSCYGPILGVALGQALYMIAYSFHMDYTESYVGANFTFVGIMILGMIAFGTAGATCLFKSIIKYNSK